MSEEILCQMSEAFQLDMYLVTALPNICHLANTILNLHTDITEGLPQYRAFHFYVVWKKEVPVSL